MIIDECNDADAAIHPGVEDLCGDSIDNNCDGDVDYKAGTPATIQCTFCDHYQLTTTYDECQALEDFYIATDGGNWTTNTNWLTNPDISTWVGINSVTAS